MLAHYRFESEKARGGRRRANSFAKVVFVFVIWASSVSNSSASMSPWLTIRQWASWAEQWLQHSVSFTRTTRLPGCGIGSNYTVSRAAGYTKLLAFSNLVLIVLHKFA